MQGMTPFLWFDDRAVEAAHFYAAIFKDSRIEGEGESEPGEAVASVTFWLNGQKFIALNGGPHFTCTPAISFLVHCETQDQVDHLWEKLSAGGEQQRCGWLKDRYGISWQIVPTILSDLLGADDADTSDRVRTAMLAMGKLEIAGLEKAAAG